MKKRKLILMYPNMRWQKEDMGTTWNLNPATLLLLASMVRDIVDVKVIDAQFRNMSKDEFVEEVKKYEPDYVGISLLTSEYQDTLNMASVMIKNANDSIIIIAGGVHVTTMYENVINNNNIDYCIIGEGEYALKKLIEWLNGVGDMPEEGLVYRSNRKIVVQKRVLIDDLTKLPLLIPGPPVYTR